MRGETGTALIVCVLLVLSVPWYFPAGDGAPFVLGFPLWGLVSLSCYAAIAVLVAWRLPRIWQSSGSGDTEDDGG